MKCALEMLAATAEDRATAKERARLAEEERLKKLRRENEAFYQLIITKALEKFEKEFRNYSGDPKDFKCFIDFKEFCFASGYDENHNWDDGICPCVKKEKSLYADNRADYNIDYGHLLSEEILYNKFSKLCYNCKASADFRQFYRYGYGAYNFLTITLSIDPKCFEKGH